MTSREVTAAHGHLRLCSTARPQQSRQGVSARSSDRVPWRGGGSGAWRSAGLDHAVTATGVSTSSSWPVSIAGRAVGSGGRHSRRRSTCVPGSRTTASTRPAGARGPSRSVDRPSRESSACSRPSTSFWSDWSRADPRTSARASRIRVTAGQSRFSSAAPRTGRGASSGSGVHGSIHLRQPAVRHDLCGNPRRSAATGLSHTSGRIKPQMKD